ncbi:MAG TPA: hypothetical protein VJN43_04870 [Bryobacteraceae bacterium]|nr:hypothetical protein [Bryobacteraceae bacterium]
MPAARTNAEAGQAFATPTIIHFGAVLGLAGILSAPWEGIGTVAALLGLVGLSGMVYTVIVVRRMRSQTAYKPEFEDWLFHVLLPFAAYVTLALSAYSALSHVREAFYAVGGAVLLLLFIGIHNAWDAVTYRVFYPNEMKFRPTDALRGVGGESQTSRREASPPWTRFELLRHEVQFALPFPPS